MQTQQFSLSDPAILFAAGGAPQYAFETGCAAGSRLYRDLPADQYHADRDALSCSMLKPLLISPGHFQASLLARNSATKAKDFGSLVHALVLQPHLVGQDFAVYPGFADLRDKEYKKFLANNPTRLVVDESTFARGGILADKILNRPVFGRPFGDYVAEGIPEASIYFEEPTTGLRLRIRMDLYHPEFDFDLKTTRHSTDAAFLRDSVEMGYDLQAFMYSLGRSLYDGRSKRLPFVFVAGETEEPHSIFDITAGESYMTNGLKKFQHVLSTYSACNSTGFWPDSSSSTVAEITPWQSFTGDASWKEALSMPTSLH